ncbi:MAG: tetratricopeptide repeat protein [Thermoanaerobaculum sp.]
MNLAAGLFLVLMANATPLEQAKAALSAGNYAQAVRQLQALSEAGEPEAQYLLGHMLDLGLGLEADPRKALSWWLKAAEKEYPPALHRAGVAYLQGRGVDPDPQRGVDLLRQAAFWGYHPAEASLGQALLTNTLGPGYVPEALRWLSCAAEAGDRQAAELVGMAYANGTEETVPDVPRAVKFLRLAETLGSPTASALLRQLDPAKDAPIATEENVHVLWESARLGFPDAQFRLAVLGLANVPWGPSRKEALKLLETAAANGHPEACYRWLQYLRKTGPVDPFVEQRLLRSAVEGGFTAASFEFGQLLAKYGSPEALRWLRTAYQLGQWRAGLELARLFLEGKIVARNEAEARRVLLELKKAEDPAVKKDAARLLLATFKDPEACPQALELDPQAECPRSGRSSPTAPTSLP